MKMMKCHFTSESTDHMFKRMIEKAKKRTSAEDKDYIVLCVGLGGVGKSVLGMHAYQLYDEKGSIDWIAMDFEEFKRKARDIKKKELPRLLDYDEANVMSREAMTKNNRSLIKWYYRNRGLNIFHWWNNVSPKVDRSIIDERLHMLIYVPCRKVYYALPRPCFHKMMRDNKTEVLTLPLIESQARKYAAWRGWFRDYQGPLRKAYDLKKRTSLMSGTDEFTDEKPIGEYVLARSLLMMDTRTFRLKVEPLIKEGKVKLGEHFVLTGVGHRKWTEAGQIALKEALSEDGVS